MVSTSEYKISCQHDKVATLTLQVSEDGKQLSSENIKFTLSAPANVKVSKQAADSIKVEWDSVAVATSYNLFYAQESFANTEVSDYAILKGGTKLGSLTAINETISGLALGNTYYVVVTAVDAANTESAKSNEVSITLDNLQIIKKPSKLNDTGITKCGTANNTDNKADCTTAVANASGNQVPLGQDGHYGTGKDGSYGMVFSHVAGHQGECVQDEHTGLMWEVKQTTAGLHHKDNEYSWYNPDTNSNGGNAGTQNGGSCAGSACDTEAFVKAVNKAGWCGHNDWRLPTIEELFSIVDYSKQNPAIDTSFFPNTASYSYWSASPYAGSDGNAWVVNFSSGYGYGSDKNVTIRVRLVRAR